MLQNKLKFDSGEHRLSFTELCKLHIAHSLRKKCLLLCSNLYYRNKTTFYHVAVGSKDQVTLELCAWVWASIVLLLLTVGATVPHIRLLRSQGDEVIKEHFSNMLLQFGISYELMSFYQLK